MPDASVDKGLPGITLTHIFKDGSLVIDPFSPLSLQSSRLLLPYAPGVVNRGHGVVTVTAVIFQACPALGQGYIQPRLAMKEAQQQIVNLFTMWIVYANVCFGQLS